MKSHHLLLLYTLLLIIFCMSLSCTHTYAETTDISESIHIDITQNSTAITVGETATASWTYSTAFPLDYYWIKAYMYNADGTSQPVFSLHDSSVKSFSYTPLQDGKLVLTVYIKSSDGRVLSKEATWIVNATTSSATPIPMVIDILQNQTQLSTGETADASWSYTAVLPLESYWVKLSMYHSDGTSATVFSTHDTSVTSLSYTPTQSGTLTLSIYVRGADGRLLSENVKWTVSLSSSSETIPTAFDIVQDDTNISIGEEATATWSYNAALPLASYHAEAYFYYEDGTYETIWETYNPEITTFSYIPSYSGKIVLTLFLKGADERALVERLRWVVTDSSPRIPRDATKDGIVTINDALCIFSHSVDSSIEINLRNSDVNGDDKVNKQDALLILQYTAGWDVTLK